MKMLSKDNKPTAAVIGKKVEVAVALAIASAAAAAITADYGKAVFLQRVLVGEKVVKQH